MGFIGIIGMGSKYTFIYLSKSMKKKKGTGSWEKKQEG